MGDYLDNDVTISMTKKKLDEIINKEVIKAETAIARQVYNNLINGLCDEIEEGPQDWRSTHEKPLNEKGISFLLGFIRKNREKK